MGEVEAKVGKGIRSDLRHDNHTVSLLTDHLVFSPKYRGKVLLGEVGEAAEEIISETCKERDIEVIDMAVNADHVHKTLLEKAFTKLLGKVLSKKLRKKRFAISGTWMGGGGEVYLRAKGL